MGSKIEMSWYQNSDVVDLAKGLLGKILCTNIDGNVTKGRIVETEAYSGDGDKACHATNQQMTKRNRVMFSSGGHAYIYLCYGIHHLFNVVSNIEGKADAVLIRAIEPVEGLEAMMLRRKIANNDKRLTGGPGVLTQAMGIQTKHYGTPLDSTLIWIEDAPLIEKKDIVATKRIGVEYAEEDASKLWRFYIKENKWVSKK